MNAPVLAALSPDTLACLSCGQAVPVDETSERVTLTATGRVGVPAPLNPDVSPQMIRTEFSRCTTCSNREQAARQILADLPEVVGRFGRDTALHRLTCALDALAALGLPYPATFNAAEVSALLRHLTMPVRWSARFAPIALADARTGTAALRPWEHVTNEMKAEVRSGFAAVLAARVSRTSADLRLTPQEGRACLLCGIGHVTLPAARVNALGGRAAALAATWTPRKINPATIGGPGSPEPIHGSLCPTCDKAATDAGAMGQTAMLTAYAAHLREHGRTAEADAVRSGEFLRIVGWAGFDHRERRSGRPGVAPNREPWDHLVLDMTIDGGPTA